AVKNLALILVRGRGTDNLNLSPLVLEHRIWKNL
ncbi:hypothetical protein V3C99_014088, partial [Haemonchus contortus]